MKQSGHEAPKQTIQEPTRQIPVVQKTDILMLGSGPAGLASTLIAAHTAAEVAIMDRFGCMGGNITSVGVRNFAWYRHEQKVEAGGIGMESGIRAKQMGTTVPDSQSLSNEIDNEGFK